MFLAISQPNLDFFDDSGTENDGNMHVRKVQHVTG